MIKTVIFDLDGTLIDSAPDLRNALNLALDKSGYPTHSLEEIHSMLGHGLYDLVAKALPQKTRGNKDIFNQVLSDYRVFYRKNLATYTKIYDGISELLEHLKNKEVQLGVLSNKQHEDTQRLTEHFFPKTFTFIQGQQEGVPTKPDPFSLLKMIKNFNSSPQGTLYIGDMPVDYKTSKAGYTKFALAGWGYGDKEDSCLKYANIRLYSPNDLLELPIDFS